MKTITLDGGSLTLKDLRLFMAGGVNVEASHGTKKRLEKSRVFVEKALTSHEPLYGINTGFGMLASKKISDDDIEKLQENLIVSHAVGIGEFLPDDVARLVMLLRANVLAAGLSGIRPSTFELLLQIINSGIMPLIPSQGSVGASGDLSPLSHLALVLIGKGSVRYKGSIMPSLKALNLAGLSPVRLAAKEGIALINGTQAMASLSAMSIIEAEFLLKLADIVSALSIEGDKASKKPFDERIHKARPHPGQIATAANVRALLLESQMLKSHANCSRVQDPYSFRCVPQVHGAIKDAFHYCKGVVEREINSCTDNPLVFYEDGEIISGGNFHGEPLAISMDTLSIAIAELGSISERRVAVLTNPLEGEIKYKYLTSNPGLNSGLAPLHVTIASIVSENKTLAHPASVDTIPTFAGQEDHVSMGMWAARKAAKIISNVEKILAMELIAACQAIDLQNLSEKTPNSLGMGTRAAYDVVRSKILYLDFDREVYKDIEKALEKAFLSDIIEAVEAAVGRLEV